MKFIDQTLSFPKCPGPRQPAVRKKTAPQSTSFLFVNSKKGQIPRQSRQPMRSHVMQHARSQRKWSTTKGVINYKPDDGDDLFSREGSLDTLDEFDVPRSYPTTPSFLDQDPTEGRYEAPEAWIDPSLESSSRTVFRRETVTDDNENGGSPQSLPILGLNHTLDPYCSLPVQLDPMARWMLDQCKSFLFSSCPD
jgi:hypothetical protein